MTNSDTSVRISADQSYLTVVKDNQEMRFHANWLRDNALDSKTRSADNGQKLVAILSLPESSLIESAVIDDKDGLIVRFFNNQTNYLFPFSWLQRNQYDIAPERLTGWVSDSCSMWNHTLAGSIPTGSYTSLATDDRSLYRWLSQIEKLGFSLLEDIPQDPNGLLTVTNLFGYARETNYGKCFDVRSEINPTNLAYTGLALQAHTDNPYRDPVPTMQILSCMENDTEGGESIVVDGFNAATILKKESQLHFNLLSQYPARFSYRGSNGVSLQSKRPMIEIGVDGEMVGIRFNNRSTAPFVDIPFDQMQEFYRAYRHLASIIEREENKVRFKLQPGQLFIVDNTRVLHSRTAFSSTGSRWLRGCYPDKDGMISTLTVLRERHEQPRII